MDFRPTQGTIIDHLGFSYAEIDTVHSRMRRDVQGTSDVSIDPKHGMKRFFVPGPDGLLIEIVDEQPIPEGIWVSQ